MASRSRRAAVRVGPAPDDWSRATDAARKLAAQYQLSLASLTGTGREGRITRDDVLRALKDR